MKSSNLAKTAAMSIIAGSALFAIKTHAVPDQPANWEKCAGIAKVGMNDCGALDGSHACAGQATLSNSAEEWVYVPEGQCAKITGGVVAKIKPAKTS